MKAINVRNPASIDRLEVRTVAEPLAPGPGEMLVRIQASSLNFHDYAVVAGFIPTKDGRIPLSDGAGTVEAVGPNVEEFKVGDHVVSCFFPNWGSGRPQRQGFAETPGDGVDGYAQDMVVRPASWFTRAPAGFSHAEAATLTTAGVAAWRALVSDGALKAGDVVLVMGTGGVSIFALQLAKSMGAVVIATSSSDAKLERLKAMGADHTINYRSHANWGQEAFALAHGQGVDHVVEIGGPGSLAQSIAAMRVGGHIALVGALAGMKGDLPIQALLGKQVRMQGLLVGSREHQQEFVRALESMKLRPVIDRTYPLEEIADAFRHLRSGAHFGKICLTVHG